LAAAGYVAAQIEPEISGPERSRPGVSREDLSRDDKWRADLKFLADELPRRHKNLFFKITREQFNREIAKIADAVPKLSDSEIRLALWRLATMIGDAHTRIYYNREKVFPIALYQFSDGVFVAATTEEGKAALGAKLVRIGRTDVERAKEIVRSIITVENESWFKQQFPNYLTDPEVLYLLKILPSPDEGEFTVKDRNGNLLVLRLRSVSAKEPIKLIRPFDVAPAKPPLYLRNPEQYYWYEYLADSKTLYLHYRRCANMPSQPFNKFAQELWEFMDENMVARLVIDLRLNGGGNSAIFDPFITALSKRPNINQTGQTRKIFVLIGRGTFSSAYLNALRLKQDTKAILIGEPTGQKPNAYGEVKTMNLPYSKLLVQYSTKYFMTAEGDPPSLAPDILVDRSSWDYINGRDPVLDRALRYKGK
jgi:hypothetical protein